MSLSHRILKHHVKQCSNVQHAGLGTGRLCFRSTHKQDALLLTLCQSFSLSQLHQRFDVTIPQENQRLGNSLQKWEQCLRRQEFGDKRKLSQDMTPQILPSEVVISSWESIFLVWTRLVVVLRKIQTPPRGWQFCHFQTSLDKKKKKADIVFLQRLKQLCLWDNIMMVERNTV